MSFREKRMYTGCTASDSKYIVSIFRLFPFLLIIHSFHGNFSVLMKSYILRICQQFQKCSSFSRKK